jgi:nitrogen fixation protein FixH
MRDMIDSSPPRGQADRVQGRHVLMMLLGFFGVIFAVNGYFLVMALRTHGGLVAIEPYRKGLAYNERIAASDAQLERGWREVLTVTRDGIVSVVLCESSGEPVVGLHLSGAIGRPSTDRSDANFEFSEVAPGTYRAVTPPLDAGSWIASLEAKTTGARTPAYRIRRRLWLKP